MTEPRRRRLWAVPPADAELAQFMRRPLPSLPSWGTTMQDAMAEANEAMAEAERQARDRTIEDTLAALGHEPSRAAVQQRTVVRRPAGLHLVEPPAEPVPSVWGERLTMLLLALSAALVLGAVMAVWGWAAQALPR